MFGRLSRHMMTAAGAALVGALLLPADSAAQDGRFRVFIPDLFPAEGTDDDFGKDVAEELRELIDEQAVRHVAIERDEIRDGLKNVDVKIEDLDCIRSRQFGPQINAQVVVCINYHEAANDMIELTTIDFIGLPGGQSFSVDSFSINKDEKEAAARRIYDAFDQYTLLEAARANCFYYAGLDQTEDAMRTCMETLEMNPADVAVQFQMAQMYRAAGEDEKALEKVEKVLELDPANSEALYLGGFIQTELGNNQQGLDYFKRYLEYNQDAASVRRTIAYDLAQQEDYEGAMALIEEGIGPDADIGLYAERGGYAFRLAGQRLQGVPMGADGERQIPAEVRALYETAIEDLTRVYEIRGDSTNVGYLQNVVNAQVQLGNIEEAIELGGRFVQTFPDTPGLWVSYAQALGRAEQIDEAIAAWDRVGELNPEYPGLYERQAQMLLRADRRDDAVPLLKRAVQNGFDASQAARMIFQDAWSKSTSTEPPNYAAAIVGIEQAKEFESNEDVTSLLNFFHGFARYTQGVAASQAQTVASARRSLPMFQEALRLVQNGRKYATENGQDLANLITNINDNIEIQELIIDRGGS